MYNTGVVDSVQLFSGSGYYFGFYHDGYLCHRVVNGRRISKIRSKDDIIFISNNSGIF